MTKNFQLGWVWLLLCISVSNTNAQTTPKVSSPSPPSGNRLALRSATGGSSPVPTAPSNLTTSGGSNREIDLTWGASTEEGGTIVEYRIYSCQDPTNPNDTDDPNLKTCNGKTKIATSPTNTYTVKRLADKSRLKPNTFYTFCVASVDATGKESTPCQMLRAKTATASFNCSAIPLRSTCMDFGVDNDVDSDTRISSNINAFYQTNGSFSFLNQVKSIYNQASGSATVAADIATLNFRDGMQVNVLTNAQAGSSGTTTPSSGAIPTLTASGAGQATQNIIYGGTFVVAETYPLLAAGASKWGSPGGLGTLIDFALKEGVDIQNFKSGTNVNVSSPPFHGSGKLEGYVQYNSINLATNSQTFVGSLFAGGSYGYDYMTRGYAQDYGFGHQMNNGIGQISFGVLINSVAKITVSRAFGPSQTYIDTTKPGQGPVNNFKAWSFGITYQSAPPSK
jgi:fibronectin type III domain protein